MFNQIVPKFGRQCQPLCLRFGRGLCTKGNKDIPIRAPWRRHDRWGDRGLFPSENFFWPFGWRRARGPFEELEDMSRTMDKMMRRVFSDPFYYGRPSHFAESGTRTEVDQVPYFIHLTLKVPITTVADDINIFHCFSEKIRHDVSDSHMKNQALFYSENKSKKLKCRLLQFLLAL